jgi:hypothetical protein
MSTEDFRREPNSQDWKPRPDPTVLTTEALARGFQGLRDYIDGQLDVLRERLRGIDVATRLLNETVNQVPTDVQKEVSHLRELMDEGLATIALQFRERDHRGDREAQANKAAIEAALAAQKEAVAKQDETNARATAKSDATTAETINRLTQLSETNTRALSEKVDDLKERISKVESVRQGAAEGKEETRAHLSIGTAVAGVLLAVLAFVGYRAVNPTPTVVTPPPVTVTVPAPPSP